MNIVFLCGSPNFTSSTDLGSMLLELEKRNIHVKAIIFIKLFSQKLFKLSWQKHGLKTFYKALDLLARYRQRRTGPDSRQRDSSDQSLTALQVAQKFGIPVYYVSDFYQKRSLELLRKLEPDLFAPIGIGIVRKQILQIPRVGTLNAHSGLLPKYRGMNMVEWSLFDGHSLGVTIHFMDEGIDTGDILLQKEFDIDTGDTIDTLRDKSSRTGKQAMIETIEKINDGLLRPIPQKSGNGKQYFRMHQRLKLMIDKELKENYGG
ncbi:Methionyl-tRNA formyltransferase [subsurface metagenome]